MGEIIAIAEQFGFKWAIGFLIVVWVIDKTKLIPTISEYWGRHRTSENARLVAQREQLFDEYRDERVRAADLVEKLRERLDQKDDIILSVERGNSRLRHALLNVHQYVALLRWKLENGGIEVPTYDGWKNDMELDDVLVERVRSIYDREREQEREQTNGESTGDQSGV